MQFWIHLFEWLIIISLSNSLHFTNNYGSNLYYEKYYGNSPRWMRIPQATLAQRNTRSSEIRPLYRNSEYTDGRYLRPDTLVKISETLGALNTVGRYLVNMTRGEGPGIPEDIPDAIYTLSEKVLGRNVTDTIAPLVREALPVHTTSTTSSPIFSVTTTESNYGKDCTTPDGLGGYCDDLSDCPQLLLNLRNLRESLCFKSLFIPGVCCPKRSNLLDSFETDQVSTLNHLIPSTTRAPTFLTATTSTYRPPTTTISIQMTIPPTLPIVGNIVDPEDCGQPENAGFRVVGGEEALSGKWPWMAAIFLHGVRRSEFWCGGSLISTKHILTAAHCTIDFKQKPFAPHQFTVRLGDVDLKRDDEPSSPVTYRVKEIRAHNKFSRVGFYNDIAILVLDRPVRKTKYVIPLCLPSPKLKNEKFADRRATVVGWGSTYYSGKESTVQREAMVPIWRNEACDQAYFQPITSNFICAGFAEGGTDACQGDSGGPLMIHWDTRWIQIGVVSFGNKCGEPGYPGVYTRVTEYIDWIKANIRN
ncbi:putative trypsin-like serine protease [Trypoxylus dichotomus]